ncbi:MAG: hypothetical protein HDR17_02680 [Lachnospiraceae bacterium]|nr:hypothetical protein [Lachnospiraceae bacterium]
MCQVFEDLAEKRFTEEKTAFARRLIARGKQTFEEIAEAVNLPLEVVRDLAACNWHKNRKYSGSIPPLVLLWF